MAPITERALQGLALLTLAGLGACAGCQSSTLGPSVDGGAVLLDASGPEVDGGIKPRDASVDGPCESTFQLSADCMHPAVVKDCANGFCKIPPGCFLMGSPECQPGRGANVEPETQVTLTHAFEIAQHETTQAEWMAAGFPNPVKGPMGEQYGGCPEPDCPVDRISWFEALAYANARSRTHVPPLPECYELQGCAGEVGNENVVCAGVRQTTASVYDCRGYRLPTDAEWEYATRAGTKGPYYGGPMTARKRVCEVDPVLELLGWYCNNVVGRSSSPVEKKLPNAWGLFDTLGNLEELTTNEYTGLGPGARILTDPGGTLGSLDQRPKRGGQVLTWPTSTTASYRGQTGWNERGPTLGFRLVRTL